MTSGYVYYVCQGRTKTLRAAEGHRCTARYVPANPLDELVWTDLCAVLTQPDHIATALTRAQGGQWLLQELQARQANVHAALTQLQHQQKRLLDAYLAQVVELSELERKRQELAQRQASLLVQQRQLEAHAERQRELSGVAQGIEAFCAQVPEGLRTATFDQRRALVELLIDRVIVADGQKFGFHPIGWRDARWAIRAKLLLPLVLRLFGVRVEAMER